MTHTRRSTLALFGSVAFSALGCGASPRRQSTAYPGPFRREYDADASPGERSASPAERLIAVPDVTSYGSKFDEIIRDLDQFLAKKRSSFQAGDTADNAQDWPHGVQKLLTPVHRAIASADSGPLRTPIVSSHRNLARYFQLGGPGVRHFSVIAGDRDRAYSVHNSWLRWLLNDDNCDLQVAGSTEFGSCHQILGHQNCRIQLTRQDFRMPSGKEKRLVWSNPKAESYSKSEIEAHESHTEPFGGCEIFESKPTLRQCPVNSGQ